MAWRFSKTSSILRCCFVVAVFSAVTSARELRYTLIEELQAGTFIGNVVEDAHLQQKYTPSAFKQLRFRFLSEPPASFIVENTTGVIRTGDRIDRETVCPGEDDCRIKLNIAVQPVQFFRIIKVTVNLVDINDNWPEFPEPEITHQILESTLQGSVFTLPSAVDLDSPTFGIQRYVLRPESDKFVLKVTHKVDGSTDVHLVLEHPLDRERQNVYTLRMLAYDGGEPAREGSVDITIRVLDANDNDPVFDNSTYEVTILENTPRHRTIVQVHARDSDTGLYGKILYGFSEQTALHSGHLFGIDENTGDIFVLGNIDFENAKVYHLAVTARDYGPDSLSADATVIVHVQDINDHAPMIIMNTLASSGTSSAEIFENADTGTFVAHITVKDKDAGRNGVINCSLNDDHFELQELYGTEFKIVTTATLDRETMPQYNLALMCRDEGAEAQTSIMHIEVIVQDVNDNSPVFQRQKYTAELIENNYEGVFVVQVNATDRDAGRNANIRYSLQRGMAEYFHVDDVNGRVTARQSFNYELRSRVTFSVTASDQGEPPLSSSTVIEITILDVNDEPPFISEASYAFSVYENNVPGTVVGTVKATDADSAPYNKFYFSLLPSRSNTDDFRIDPQTGIITTTKVLDRESFPVYHIVVSVSNRGLPPLSSTATVNIFIQDKNDNAPTLDYPTNNNNTIYVSNHAPIGYVITRVRAHDADSGGNAKISYHFSEGNDDGVFSIDPNLGVIMLNVDLSNVDHEVYEVVVLVRDHGVPQRSVVASLNIAVNKSLDFAVAHSSLLSRHNVTIVISLACVSALITVILIVVIVGIRRQDRAKKTHKYNCRMEALKMLTARETSKDVTDDHSSSSVTSSLKDGYTLKDMPNGSCHLHMNGDRPRKEVSFSADVESGSDKGKPSWPSLIDQQTLQHPQASSSLLANPCTPPTSQATHKHCTLSYCPASRGNSHDKPWTGSHHELQVHQLLAMLKREHDNDSAYSGDGSSADSGQGGSDVGDGALMRGLSSQQIQGLFFGGRALRPPPPARDDSFSNSNSNNQIVPEMSGVSASNTTDSSDQRPAMFQTDSSDHHPAVSQTFAVRQCTSRRPEDHQNKGGINVLNSTTVAPSMSTNLSQRESERPRYTHGSAFVNSSYGGGHDNNSCRGDSQTSCYGDGQTSCYVGGQSSRCGTEASYGDTDGGLQYSCADMSEALDMKTLSRFDMTDKETDETATSGSYVVDPQQLCNEIDDLFFRDMLV